MNKLATSALGGVKLDLDDLEFQHQAYLKAFDGLLGVIGHNILVGASLTNGTAPGFDIALSWSAGHLLYNGEHYVIAAGGPINLSSGGDDEIYVKLDIGFDPAGEELNKVGAPISTYVKRQATIAVAPVGDASSQPGYVCLYNNALKPTPRVVALDTSKYQHISGQSLSATIGWNKTVKLSGRFRMIETTPVGGFINNFPNYLPVELRPSIDRSYLVYVENTTSIALLIVYADGSIFLRGIDGTQFQQNAVVDVGCCEWSVS